MPIKTFKSFETVLNRELAKASDWLIANKVTLNIKKSNYVTFHPPQKKLVYQPAIKMFDNNLQRLVLLDCKHHVKYLGVLIDKHLRWKSHIDQFYSPKNE